MTYGHMTHSWLNSPEHNATKKERAKATAEYEKRGVYEQVEVLIACTCIHRPYAHLHHKEAPATPEAARWQRVIRMTGGE
jgi:hypothetical protein